MREENTNTLLSMYGEKVICIYMHTYIQSFTMYIIYYYYIVYILYLLSYYFPFTCSCLLNNDYTIE